MTMMMHLLCQDILWCGGKECSDWCGVAAKRGAFSAGGHQGSNSQAV